MHPEGAEPMEGFGFFMDLREGPLELDFRAEPIKLPHHLRGKAF